MELPVYRIYIKMNSKLITFPIPNLNLEIFYFSENGHYCRKYVA